MFNRIRHFLEGLTLGLAAHASARAAVFTGERLMQFAGHVAAAAVMELTHLLK